MLGWTLNRNPEKQQLNVSKPRLTQSIIELLGMNDTKKAATPYRSYLQLHTRSTYEPSLDLMRYPYSSAVGALLYLIDYTRNELAYIVNVLSQHMR